MLTPTKKFLLFASVICLVGSVSSSGYSQTNLLRFPDIHVELIPAEHRRKSLCSTRT